MRFRPITGFTIIAAIAFGFSATAVQAQSAAEALLVEEFSEETIITDGDFYTQIQFNIDSLRPPTDDKGRSRFGKALLNALGLDKKTRAITVTAQVQGDGVTLPETPLITYFFDSSRSFTRFSVTDGYLTPRMNIPSGLPVRVTLRYRHVENTEYNPNFLTDGMDRLFPYFGVVNAVSTPFVAGMTDLASEVLEAAGSRELDSTRTQPMSPYSNADNGDQRLIFTLKSPGRGEFGRVEVAILAAPGLRRDPEKVESVSNTVFNRLDTDNAATLTVRTPSGSVNLLNEIKNDPSFSEMRNAISKETIGSFCSAARGISTTYSLTRMDRNNLIYRALQDEGFVAGVYRQDANTWLSDCFEASADRSYLEKHRSIDFSPVLKPTGWPPALKWAVGCQMRRIIGADCENRAPNQAGILGASMADTVEVGHIALPSIDQSAFPNDRNVQSSDLISALAGTVDAFNCFKDGLVLRDNNDNYFFNVTYENERITKMNILNAPDDVHLCLG